MRKMNDGQRASLELAIQRGYLACRARERPVADAYRDWCRQHARPFVAIHAGQVCAALELPLPLGDVEQTRRAVVEFGCDGSQGGEDSATATAEQLARVVFRVALQREGEREETR